MVGERSDVSEGGAEDKAYVQKVYLLYTHCVICSTFSSVGCNFEMSMWSPSFSFVVSHDDDAVVHEEWPSRGS